MRIVTERFVMRAHEKLTALLSVPIILRCGVENNSGTMSAV
jgi:hypothetical protein